MNEQNVNEKTWWSRNKKKVFVIGGVLIVAVGTYLVLKKRTSVSSFLKRVNLHSQDMTKVIEQAVEEIPPEITEHIIPCGESKSIPLNNGLPFEVKGFLRDLPKGQHPSSKKIAQALKLGIDLGPNQTIVDPYFKNIA